MNTDVFYVEPESTGYHPVTHMARLAAELFESELVVLQRKSIGLAEQALSFLPRSRQDTAALLICTHPADLKCMLLVDGWRRKYGNLVAWVFDSFCTDDVPRLVRAAKIFDHVFVTEPEDVAQWRKMMPGSVDWLPWGSDTLRLGSTNADRPVDLRRIGRQPPEWEDDAANEAACQAMNIRFQGRTRPVKDASESERALMDTLGQAKFTLSFSNQAAPASYTHPERDYITARWTDALSAGAIVAGIPPRTESVQALLWNEALLDLGTIGRGKGLEVLAEEARAWTPQQALRNNLRSLEMLDWRWRFEKIAAALGVRPKTLDNELSLLRRTIEERCRSV